MIKEETDVLEDICRSRLGRLAVEQEGPHKRHLWHEAWPSESAVSVMVWVHVGKPQGACTVPLV